MELAIKTRNSVNGKQISIGKFPPGKRDYLSRNSAFFRKISSGTTEKVVFHLHPNRNFRKFSVNGKRPMFLCAIKLKFVKTVRSNLPTINAPATNMSTVHKFLVRSLTIKDTFQLKSIVVVLDQALYAKATEIVWKYNMFKGIVLRMGAFHTFCTLLSILGKRFQYADLRGICIESRVIAEGSVSGVLVKRRYSRTVRFHKLMYEALQRLARKGFQSWHLFLRCLTWKENTQKLLNISNLGDFQSHRGGQFLWKSSSLQACEETANKTHRRRAAKDLLLKREP